MTDQLPSLRDLDYSPYENPLLSTKDISVKRRHVRTGVDKKLVDTETGEVSHVAMIHTIEERDDAEFVKVFAAGVKAIYDLTRTGHRVFQNILDEYQRTPMNKGFADTVYLSYFDGTLCGHPIDMSHSTFKRGLRELLAKKFLAPRSPDVYWVNPALFFKGDRVAFIREFRRTKTKVNKLEDQGQQRLID